MGGNWGHREFACVWGGGGGEGARAPPGPLPVATPCPQYTEEISVMYTYFNILCSVHSSGENFHLQSKQWFSLNSGQNLNGFGHDIVSINETDLPYDWPTDCPNTDYNQTLNIQ